MATAGKGASHHLPYRQIGNTDLEGCVYLDMIWLRGPCGIEHPMSLDTARQLGLWLDDLTHPVIDGAAEDVSGQRGLPSAPT